MISSALIMQQWQQGKIASATAKSDLIRSRCVGAQRAHAHIDWHEEQSTLVKQSLEVRSLELRLEASLGSFRSHPLIDTWLEDYSPNSYGKIFRHRTLLLRGESQSGKTRKAVSLFGVSRTLQVNSQGLGASLPSLREFRRGDHLAIVFDEANEEQVLQNKLVFQAGPAPVALSQSACNQHAYSRWLYNVPMIVCSNTFRMEAAASDDKPLSLVDQDWLRMNVVDVRLRPGQRWYHPPADPEPVLPIMPASEPP